MIPCIKTLRGREDAKMPGKTTRSASDSQTYVRVDERMRKRRESALCARAHVFKKIVANMHSLQIYLHFSHRCWFMYRSCMEIKSLIFTSVQPCTTFDITFFAFFHSLTSLYPIWLSLIYLIIYKSMSRQDPRTFLSSHFRIDPTIQSLPRSRSLVLFPSTTQNLNTIV